MSVGVAEAVAVAVVEVDLEGARRGGRLRHGGALRAAPDAQGGHERRAYGKKLQLEAGRLDTSVNISEIKRCCTAVS